MDKPPRFVRSPDEARLVFMKLKLMVCPHCGATNCLIRNGKLKGCDPGCCGNACVIRGQRLLCSARGRNQGCGRSSAIYFRWILPGFTVDARLLWIFLQKMFTHAVVQQAWLGLNQYFSLSSAYRWWRRLAREQSRLRVRLWSFCPPPACSSPEPRDHILEHLLCAFPQDPVAAFQLQFQAPVFA